MTVTQRRKTKQSFLNLSLAEAQKKKTVNPPGLISVTLMFPKYAYANESQSCVYKLLEVVVVVRAQSCPTLCFPWTIALQAPSSIEFSRQVYWSRLPFPSPGDLSNPEIELASLVSPSLQVNSLPLAPPGEPLISSYITINKTVKFSKITAKIQLNYN